MSKIIEDLIIEAAKEAEIKSVRQTAERMIKGGEISLEKIAYYIPSLSIEELRKIEAEVMQLV